MHYLYILYMFHRNTDGRGMGGDLATVYAYNFKYRRRENMCKGLKSRGSVNLVNLKEESWGTW